MDTVSHCVASPHPQIQILERIASLESAFYKTFTQDLVSYVFVIVLVDGVYVHATIRTMSTPKHDRGAEGIHVQMNIVNMSPKTGVPAEDTFEEHRDTRHETVHEAMHWLATRALRALYNIQYVAKTVAHN